MNFIRRNFGIVIVLLLCFFAIRPLFMPGFFPMHDNEQVGRLFELNKTLAAGEVPPRMAQDLGFGYDYPFFNFYPSFVYYLAEIFVVLGFSFIVSTKIVIALGFLLAAFAMYICARKFFGELAGIIAAVAYTYAPYHSVDVYVRGAIPEFFSFVFIPLLFWGYAKLSEGKNRKYYVIFLAFINAFFILTHDLIVMMSSLFLGPFIIYLITCSKEKVRFVIDGFLSFILGLGLTSYFWLPAYFEKQYTMIELLTKELASYTDHFVYIRQFWNSPWGYGGSVPGPNDGLSFQVGQAQIVFAAVSSVFLFVSSKIKKLGILFIFLFMLSLFMATSYSKSIWDSISQFSYIQFPWRFLLFSDFFVALILSSFFSKFEKKAPYYIISVCICAVLIYTNVSYFAPSEYLTSVKDSDYTSLDILRFDTSKIAAEYSPKGIATRKTDINTTVVDITKDEIAKSPYNVVSGNMTVSVLDDKPQEKTFSLNVLEPGIFRLNTFSFPGWTVSLNGKDVLWNSNNKFKLITFNVPKGNLLVKAAFTDTPIRRAGNLISLASFFVLASLFLLYRGSKSGV